MNARAKGLVLGLGIAAVLGVWSCGGGIGGANRFTDDRDGRIYRTVRIGNRTWFAENLNYQTEESWCYNNNDLNCKTYGRLYDWNAAMSACPAGWRLPNDADWDDLMTAIGGVRHDRSDIAEGAVVWESAGTKLKSKTGWIKGEGYVSGTDNFNFSALPNGSRWADGSFYGAGYYGFWWSAAENDAGDVRNRSMHYNLDNVYAVWNDKDVAFSVRCVMD